MRNSTGVEKVIGVDVGGTKVAAGLVDNSGNYRRSRASLRILRPMVGNGLLLSEGEDWKHQRRTIAPALAPLAANARNDIAPSRSHLIAFLPDVRSGFLKSVPGL